MSEGGVRLAARCEECDRAYRVPSAERTYSCKACGGTVRVSADEPTPAPTRAEQAAQLRHEATSALKRAYTWIAAVGWLYRVGALVYALATLFAVLALARTEVPLGGGVVVVGLTSLLSVLMLMGAIHILFKPFVWTVVIASLATVVSVVHYFGPNPFGVAFLGSAAWAVVFWAALVPTFRFSRLIAEHKDLYILHHASVQTRRSLKDRSAEERHERLLRAMRRAARRAWKISTAVAVAFVLFTALGTYMVVANVRPQLLSDALERFEAAWNDTGLEAACAFFDAEVRARECEWVTGVVDGHGWTPALPRLEDGRRREEQGSVWVDYELDDITLSTRWFLDDQEWVLMRIELPIPPLAPVFERFLAAWRNSDPEGLAAFFSPENRESMRASIEVSVRRRGWDPFPEILDTQVSEDDSGEAQVTLTVEAGEVTTRWHLRSDGRWGLHGLKFPRHRD